MNRGSGLIRYLASFGVGDAVISRKIASDLNRISSFRVKIWKESQHEREGRGRGERERREK
jgi:hypothetical protein